MYGLGIGNGSMVDRLGYIDVQPVSGHIFDVTARVSWTPTTVDPTRSRYWHTMTVRDRMRTAAISVILMLLRSDHAFPPRGALV